MINAKDIVLITQGKLGINKFVPIQSEWKNEELLMNGVITECGENVCWDVDNYQEETNPRLKISKRNKLLDFKDLENGRKYISIKVLDSDDDKYFVEVFDILKD